jgi:hypothetical protein
MLSTLLVKGPDTCRTVSDKYCTPSFEVIQKNGKIQHAGTAYIRNQAGLGGADERGSLVHQDFAPSATSPS